MTRAYRTYRGLFQSDRTRSAHNAAECTLPVVVLTLRLAPNDSQGRCGHSAKAVFYSGANVFSTKNGNNLLRSVERSMVDG